jgi:hypothetical protein
MFLWFTATGTSLTGDVVGNTFTLGRTHGAGLQVSAGNCNGRRALASGNWTLPARIARDISTPPRLRPSLWWSGRMSDCEIVMVRGVEDANGYPCGRTSVAECCDCGAKLCDLHFEECDLCHETYCSMCFLFQDCFGQSQARILRRPPDRWGLAGTLAASVATSLVLVRWNLAVE